MDRPDPGFVAGCQDCRAGPVSDQDAGAPVGPVGEVAEFFRSDDQGRGRGPGTDRLIGNGHRMSETRTGGVDVENGRRAGADAGRDPARGAGGTVFGRDGGNDDQVQVHGVHPGVPQGVQSGTDGHIGHRLGVRDAARFDSHPAADPFVTGVHNQAQLTVREHPAGLVGAGPGDTGSADRRVRHAAGRRRGRVHGWLLVWVRYGMTGPVSADEGERVRRRHAPGRWR
ncbi:hypothetical protein D9M72_520470 [compost metagenome]